MQVPRTRVLRRPRRFVRNRSQLVLKSAQWGVTGSRAKAEQLLSRVGFPRPRLVLSYILLCLGTVLCSYVAGNYLWMYAQQQKLLKQWRQNNSISSANALTKLSIPRIHLEAVVLEGASQYSLLQGPARLAESALPGSLGNTVIAGHRDTFFRHVHSLKYGDDIYVLKSGQRFHYTVVGRKVVEPTDLSVLRSSKQGQLTLITCYPTHAIGPAPQRLIITAKLARDKLLAKSSK
jgi:LPXTG-site transpeptidase (sortase) family protein